MSLKKPDFVFELSWEVCNMVGGIHTVIQSKASKMEQFFGDDYVCVGPIVPHPLAAEPVFVEEIWSEEIYKLCLDFSSQGVACRMGRWCIAGRPKVLLVGFRDLFTQKDRILTHYWERYGVNSLFSGHDYVEPVLFSHGAALLIEQICNRLLFPESKTVVVHAHEWMTSMALLHLKEVTPEVATVFTTHATVLGRSLSSRSSIKTIEACLKEKTPENWSKELGVEAKHSLESVAARESDCFTTVSETTSLECEHTLSKKADIIVKNGLSEDIPDQLLIAKNVKDSMRIRLLKIAEEVTGYAYDLSNTFIVATSGRYEFKNKGVDIFLEGLLDLRDQIKSENSKRKILAFLMLPAGHLQAVSSRSQDAFCTHQLMDSLHDPILNALWANHQVNSIENPVHFVFIPIYLNGTDPSFPETYWELLAGVDLAVFPSLYEPWGYTPHEAISLGIPTVTSNTAGFGRWIQSLPAADVDKGVVVLSRRGNSAFEYTSHLQVRNELSKAILEFYHCDSVSHEKWSKGALQSALQGRWKELITGYLNAFSFALERANERTSKNPSSKFRTFTLGNRVSTALLSHAQVSVRSFSVTTRFSNIQRFLRSMVERSMSLKWNPKVFKLLELIDPKLWEFVDRSPVRFINSLGDEDILKVSRTPELKKLFQEIRNEAHLPKLNPTEFERAYFCMEYGISDKLRIYSGGLGILAGDHLKTAADMKIPLVAFGLFYQFGYFRQILDPDGKQHAHYHRSELENLSLSLVQDENGVRLLLSVPFLHEPLYFQVWRLELQTTCLYLLDTNVIENSPRLRAVTDRLYASETGKRISQEWLLSMGGLKIIEKLKLGVKVFHMNEGHTAFLVVGRTLALMAQNGLSFEEAFSYVRFTMVFTTHTPVPAGHDEFSLDEAVQLLKLIIPDAQLLERFVTLASSLTHNGARNHLFSMTGLALRGSRWVNAVSKIHKGVSQRLFNGAYSDLDEEEVPVSFVTNGVHVPYWMDCSWQQLFYDFLGDEWPRRTQDREYWSQLKKVPLDEIRKTKTLLKKKLVSWIKKRLASEIEHGNGRSEYPKILGSLDPKTLIITHAKRIAPYKRTDLLFQDPDRLARLIRNSPVPILFIYAGKSHPTDGMGQEILRNLCHWSRDPRFKGSVLVLEGYNLSYARRLLAGSDLWLNTPLRPLEASGTSGMKAAINGTLHFSVADGWWPEAYNGSNGWMLGEGKEIWDQPLQDEYDRAQIFSYLEQEILPEFGKDAWYERVRESIATVLPFVSSERMLSEYNENCYQPSLKLAESLQRSGFEQLKNLSKYNQKIKDHWSQVAFDHIYLENLRSGKISRACRSEVILELTHPGLTADCLQLEALLTHHRRSVEADHHKVIQCELTSASSAAGRSTWKLILENREPGDFELAFRVCSRRLFEFDDSAIHHKLIRWM